MKKHFAVYAFLPLPATIHLSGAASFVRNLRLKTYLCPAILFCAVLIASSAGIYAKQAGLNQVGLNNALLPDEPDTDGDGVGDVRDNCSSTYNPEKIAYTSLFALFVMNADGTGKTQLTNFTALHPSISPDGSKIAFVAFPNGTSEIFVADIDGSHRVRLTNRSGIKANPRWSPDGSKIVFDLQSASDREIYVMNSDGSNLTQLTDTELSNFEPTFSPDGSKIAFVGYRATNTYEIYVMDADGSNIERLTNNSFDDFYPSFSADGSKIVFQSRRNFIEGIYAMNSDGSNQTSLTGSMPGVSPTVSPDGKQIAFVSSSDIYVMNADGTNPVKMTDGAFIAYLPSWGRQADSDNDGIGDACDNTAPTITAANAVSVARNAGLISQPIATVSDQETPAAGLSVTVVGAPPSGVSIENVSVGANGVVTANVTAACSAALGANPVMLRVSDGELTATASMTINVTPSAPALINLNPFAVLSPPNHKLQTFAVSQMVQSATDDCRGDVLSNVIIEKATSDEFAETEGSGNTLRDIVIGADCRSIELRSERSGIANGRVYTITLKVTDSSGNITRAEYKVFVPKGSQPAIEDAAAYAVYGGCY